jgi:hypothetical protein
MHSNAEFKGKKVFFLYCIALLSYTIFAI